MDDENGKILAHKISKVLAHLKTNKVTQYEIEQKLNYTSLSKAKNFSNYPQPVIEKKTRSELLKELLATYNLSFDEKLGEVRELNKEGPLQIAPDVIYYIMYYYAFARNTIDKAIVRIVEKRKVFIDYRLDEHWEGTYEVIENYTFINVVKMGDTTPVKKMISLFSGTKRYGRPILLGTYSTVKRDGYPAAGSILMEKVEEADIDKKIKREADSRIEHYLINKVLITETFTPNSLNNLKTDYELIKTYSGEYLLFYPKNERQLQADLTLNDNSTCTLMSNGIKYEGYFTILDVHTIKIELNDTATDFSHTAKESITLFINTKNLSYQPFYLVRCLSNAFEATPVLFKCLVVLKSNYRDGEKLQKFVKDFDYQIG